MIKLYLLFIGLYITSSCSSHPVTIQNSLALDIQDKDISRLIKEHQLKGEIPALGLLLLKEGRAIYFSTEGLRSVQHNTYVEITDKWHLGSDTKAMTAFLIALAVQESKINYNASVTKFLDFKSNKYNENIKISDLLVHESGLKDIGEINGGKIWISLATSTLPITEQRIQITKAALNESPRKIRAGSADTTFSYANTNYIILGAILEKIYQTPWENLITEKIFKPLTMDSCSFGVAGFPDETTPSQPWAHYIHENKLVSIPPKYKADNPPVIGPAGSVHCNLNDWSKFISELIFTYNKKGHLLHKNELTEHYFKVANSSYTFGGWGKHGDSIVPVFQHAGSNTFNYALATFSPAKNTMILMTMNTAQPKSKIVFNKLHETLVKRFLTP